MNWIKTSEQLPEIDTSDDWNEKNKISKDVLCYSTDYGMRFGRYYYNVGYWTVNGVTSTDGVPVTYWLEIEPPI